MKTNEVLKTKNIKLGEIPCYYLKPNFRGNDATVVYYHGWGSNKENSFFIGKILAFHGYEVIMPDAIHHGDRGALQEYNVEAMREYFWDVIFNTVKEYEVLINEAAKSGINTDKIAVMGSSMGGFIASGVFADNREIKSLVNMNGACAWDKAEEFFRNMDREEVGAASPQQKELIKQYDPLGRKKDLYPRPILMMHGEEDASVDIEIERYFYKEIINLYEGCSDKIKLMEISKLNHLKTIGMMEETVKWLDKYL